MNQGYLDTMTRILGELGPSRSRRLVLTAPMDAMAVERDGRRLINFSSNDYLGLARDPRLARAAARGCALGVGAGASRLVCGTFPQHQRLEGALCALKGTAAALVMGAGFQTNLAVLAALLDPQVAGGAPQVFADRLAHASLLDGARLAGASPSRFRHNDLGHLDELLRRCADPPGFRLILTESVFSMDGDRADLPGLAALAIHEQAARLEQVIFAGCTHEPAVTLCRRLTALLPAGLRRCFFSDNGSTAVEVALKMALQARGNRGERANRFLAFQGGYHGDTVGAMSAGASSGFFAAWRDLLFPVDLLPVADTWMDDPDVAAREAAALSRLDQHLERHGTATAAAIIEPLVQGAGGMRMHRPAFLAGVVERLRARGILVILDEVMTGFGRLGPLFACLAAGVAPDFLCLSKGLTGGALPMGLTVTTEAVHQAFLDPGMDKAFLHGHSFTANPLGCAAALASLDLLLDPACARARARIERRHRTVLAPLVNASRNARRMRIQGTIAAFDLVTPAAGDLRGFFQERGLLLRPLGNTLYLLPPFCMTDAQLDRAYRGIAEALDHRAFSPP